MEMRPSWRREVSRLHSQPVGFRLRKGWAWDTGSGLGNMQSVALRPGCCEASSGGLRQIRSGTCIRDTLTQGSGSPGFYNPHSFIHSFIQEEYYPEAADAAASMALPGPGHLSLREGVQWAWGISPRPFPRGPPITLLHSAQGCRKAGRGRFQAPPYPGLRSSLGTPRAHSPRRGRGRGRARGCPQGLFP